MKNVIKNLTQKSTLVIAAMAASVFMFSCDNDAEVEPQMPQNEPEVATEEIEKLEVMQLATIALDNGMKINFRAEEDGIVYEETNNFDGIGYLENESMLARFLTLTGDNVAVPKVLVDLSEETALKELAMARGTVLRHESEIVSTKNLSKKGDEVSVMASAWCSGGHYSNKDVNGTFARYFYNYSWGTSAATVYGSWKSGGSKCKTVNLYLKNCSNSNTLSANTWYKNVFGNYKKQDVINVGAGSSRFWSKTYTTKRYRRAFVSGFGSGKFGGYVLFKNY